MTRARKPKPAAETLAEEAAETLPAVRVEYRINLAGEDYHRRREEKREENVRERLEEARAVLGDEAVLGAADKLDFGEWCAATADTPTEDKAMADIWLAALKAIAEGDADRRRILDLAERMTEADALRFLRVAGLERYAPAPRRSATPPLSRSPLQMFARRIRTSLVIFVDPSAFAQDYRRLIDLGLVETSTQQTMKRLLPPLFAPAAALAAGYFWLRPVTSDGDWLYRSVFYHFISGYSSPDFVEIIGSTMLRSVIAVVMAWLATVILTQLLRVQVLGTSRPLTAEGRTLKAHVLSILRAKADREAEVKSPS